jgi:hypothetical protein
MQGGWSRHSGRRRYILEDVELADAARALYEAPFAVLAHDKFVSDEPAFTYANQARLALGKGAARVCVWGGSTATRLEHAPWIPPLHAMQPVVPNPQPARGLATTGIIIQCLPCGPAQAPQSVPGASEPRRALCKSVSCWLGRQAALDLFEATWEEFIGTPSRVSADDEAQVRCAAGRGQGRHVWLRWSAPM